MDSKVLLLAPQLEFGLGGADAQVGGLELLFCGDAQMALRIYAREDPALVVVDTSLLQVPLSEFCDALRRRRRRPVVALLDTESPEEVAQALEDGADDCISSGLPQRELVARMRAWLRRATRYAASGRLPQMTVGPLSIDVARHEVTVNSQPIDLTPREFDLLVALARDPYAARRREDLLAEVWGTKAGRRSRTLDVHIGRLRQKIEPDPQNPILIATVGGVGYRLHVVEAARKLAA